MKKVLLAIDVILSALIGPTPGHVDKLIDEARKAEIQIVIEHFALFCALRSLRDGDTINIVRFTELMKYSQIQTSKFRQLEDRESWEPAEEEIDRWRTVALQN